MGRQTTLRRNLRYSIFDNFFFSLMVGASESFFAAFALALGLGEVTAGMLAAIPFLIGSTLQLLSPWCVRKVGSYRKWIVFLASVQAIGFIPLAYLGFVGEKVTAPILIAIVSIYWTCNLAAGPAWNTWMSSLVPGTVRSKYIARRSHVGQIGLVLGLMFGGLLLHVARQGGWELTAFGLVFVFAGVSRALSASFQRRKSEATESVEVQKRLPPFELLRRIQTANDGRLIGAILVFSIAVHISSPFYNPFMLTRLKLSYGEFMLLIAASLIAKVVMFSAASRLKERFEPLAFMRVGMIGAATIPIFWILSDNYYYLFAMQVMSGALWAMYDLGITLALFSTIRDEERTSLMSYYNFATALMITLGTTLGGQIMSMVGEGRTAYYVVFGLSAVARFGAVYFFDRANALSKVEVSKSAKVVALPIFKEASKTPVRMIGGVSHTVSTTVVHLARPVTVRMRKR